LVRASEGLSASALSRTVRREANRLPARRRADVQPAIGILRIDLGDFLEGSLRRFSDRLQQQTDAVIVPTLPVFFH